MPNLYITPAEIKDLAPDEIRSSTTKYDDALLRLANMVSRWIDRRCGRKFYPIVEKRYFTALDGEEIFIDDLITVTTLKTDEDADRTYETTWATTDYDLLPDNEPGSYNQIMITPNGNNAFPTNTRKGVEIDGVWAFADDRSLRDTGQNVQDDPLTDSSTSLTVTDIDGDDLYGISPVIAAGMLLRLESEYVEVTTTNTTTNVGTIIRGANSSTAAQHAQNVDVERWLAPEPIRQAAAIMSVRAMERAKQAYGDSRAVAELGEMQFVKAIDPEVQLLLEPYQKLRF